MQTLRNLLIDLIEEVISDATARMNAIATLEKLLVFDVSSVFDTYIGSMIYETEIAKAKSEAYISTLEEKAKERTEQLEILSRTDPLAGLLNVRHLRACRHTRLSRL